MATKNEPEIKKPEIKRPEKWDLQAGMLIARKVIEENQEWLKEMAKR